MTLRKGLVSTEQAFGKRGVMLENTIKKIGWSETPFLSTISTAAPSDRSSNVALGHQWFYDEIPDGELNNAHIEGGAMAEIKKSSGGSLKNHFQIVKNAYGVTGSEDVGVDIDGSAQLSKQFAASSVVHKKTLETILLSDQEAVARINTEGSKAAGKCGGLKSFATSKNSIDAGGAELEWKHILEILKIGYLNGATYKILMLADKQNDRLNALLDSKTRATMDTNFLGTVVQSIKNTSYGSNIKIILNPFLKQDEILVYRPEDIYKVNWRAMHTKDRITTDDAVAKEIISEFTLRVCTPYAFCWLKNLKAS